ncbi:hypothetical protein MJO29_007176, partial [Puccinia striiformis f. sp. tritici]
VREKQRFKITAINLNKMTLNWETVQKIKKGLFSFAGKYLGPITMSPKVFLNSLLFTELLFSKEFQNILALIMVDDERIRNTKVFVYLIRLIYIEINKCL